MKKILKAQSYWNNKDFIAELDKRSTEYKSGKKKQAPGRQQRLS